MVDFGTSPDSINSHGSESSIEINDCLFCEHGKERCDICQCDTREDNALTLGVEPADLDREPIEVEFAINMKDGVPHCKKHKSASCKNCWSFKKMINKANKDYAKENKNKKKETFLGM